jgi:predicted P-loop ATPase
MMAENVIPLNAWRGQLDLGEKGVKRNLTNLILHLRNCDGLGREIRFNEMTAQVEWHGQPIEDHHVVDIRLIIERNGFQPVDRDVRPAIDRVARENKYNPVADYLTGLAWDGKPRCDEWMIRLMGAPDSPFVRLVSAKTLISAVARALDPGCQVDTVLVIEGEQGIKKSSAIAALFGPEYTRESVSLFDSHQRMVMNMMGAWCVELAEFVAVARNHHASVKGMISMRRDTVVLPYAKSASTHPRRCIFFGTINPEVDGYLTDATGNRRYWPVTATKIDLDGIRLTRDQIWAEAVHRYRDGERWWLEGEENILAQSESADRETSDIWEEVLSDRIAHLNEITVAGALRELGVPFDRMGKNEKNRMANVLRSLGFSVSFAKVRDESGNRKSVKTWRRK